MKKRTLTIDDLASQLDPAAAAALRSCSPQDQEKILAAYRENADWRGGPKRVITTPPTPGSRRYPWLKGRNGSFSPV